MQVIRAPRFSGFCGGVKRAWTIALRTRAVTEGPVYLSGELINNGPAMHELEERGLSVLRVIDGEVPAVPGTLVMRAHGESPVTFARAQELGLPIVDATCGIVRAVQQKAKALEESGWQVILYGHHDHPEARATIAYTQHGLIVDSLAEAEALTSFERIAALAQTTVLLADYDQICEVLKTKTSELANHGQICAWTRMAQEEAAALALECSVVVVVGGRGSSNTRRLVDVASEHVPTYLVETVEELEPGWFQASSVVGVCAGASTREGDVASVMARLETLGQEMNVRTAE
ncbi:MAG: 4-hydroxy-3-methylbut-2-enyl diphosphate reductase [Chloroflexi bacterium]|nr:4-hydroxy-3-methylbut-2-enyl diphosphate reductase [Chloroflexota bacterium]